VRTNQQLRQQSRERILAAALAVFAEKGYEAASISDITEQAGVSRGLVSYYFAGKDRLAAELLGRWLDGITAVVGLTGPADERLAAIIDGALTAAVATLPEQRLAISLMMQPCTHPVFAEVEAHRSERLTAVEDAIRSVFAERGGGRPGAGRDVAARNAGGDHGQGGDLPGDLPGGGGPPPPLRGLRPGVTGRAAPTGVAAGHPPTRPLTAAPDCTPQTPAHR
jgi:AcrR family transcriptional regulator